MITLIFAIIFGTASGLIYKAAVQTGCRRVPLIAVERAIIVALMCVYALRGTGFDLCPTVMLVAVAGGVTIFASRWLLLKTLGMGNVAVSWTIFNLSVTVPILFSIFVWGEIPNVHQTLGLVLVPVGIIFMRERTAMAAPETEAGNAALKTDQARRRAWLICVLLCFFMEGTFGLCFKLLKEWDLADSRNMFILLYNFCAMILSGSVVMKTRTVPGRKELFAGICAGLMVTAAAVLWALAVIALPGIVFFPVVTASGIVLMAVSSRLIWKETTTGRQKFGMALAVGAVILIAL